MRYTKQLLIFLGALFMAHCASSFYLGVPDKTPIEDGVHVILHPTLNLIHYNNEKKQTTNNSKSAHHFLIEPGKQTLGVKSAYTKKIWAFYSKVHDVTIEGKEGEPYLICSAFVKEKTTRPTTGGSVIIETKIDVLKITSEQKKEIYVDDNVQIEYLRSICPSNY